MYASHRLVPGKKMKKLDPERAGPCRKANGISKGKTEETKVIIKAMGCFGREIMARLITCVKQNLETTESNRLILQIRRGSQEGI